MKRIFILYIALVATIITASAQTSTPPQAERRQHVQALPLTGGVGGGLEGAPFWTCPDTIRPATIIIDQDFPNTAPGFVDPNSVRVGEQGNYSLTVHNKNYGQTLVGGHGYRNTLDASEPVLMVATDHYRDFYFVALPGQHLHFVYDFSGGGGVITEAYEECADGTTKPLINVNDVAPDFVEEVFNTFGSGMQLPSAYIDTQLIGYATNPDVARRLLQPSIDLLFANAPQGLSIKHSLYSFIYNSNDPLIDLDAKPDSTASKGSKAPIYRKEQPDLSFTTDLIKNFNLPAEDSLPDRGFCTLWLEVDPKGNLADHHIFHCISPAFDAALTEALLPLFPFDAPARVSGKACRFRATYNVIYSKHGEAPITRAASANPLSVFQPFIDIFTLPDVEIPFAVKLSRIRVSGEERMPQRIFADYGDFVQLEHGEPSLTVVSKAHDEEPFATWFQQLFDRQKVCREMSPLERQRIAKDLANTIDDYRSKNFHLPMFYYTIDSKFNGDSRRYADHIFKTSLLFNRQRLNRFYEDLDHAHLFEDEGFNFLISILDFAKQQE